MNLGSSAHEVLLRILRQPLVIPRTHSAAKRLVELGFAKFDKREKLTITEYGRRFVRH